MTARYNFTALVMLAALVLPLADAAAQTGLVPVSAPAPAAAFEAFLTRARGEAVAKGVRVDIAEKVLTGFAIDPEVLELLNRQPEHDRTVGDYVRLLVNQERIDTGRAKLAEHAAVLDKIEARYGVPRNVLVAIWGIETRFGAAMGDRQIIRSLATLAYGDERRSLFWLGELVAALRILQSGDIAPELMLGSWAGAMGHTQFMPTTYLKHAVDIDADGRRDVWANPGDALASAASYLKASGWLQGAPWGVQVKLPTGFDYGLSAPGKGRPWREWQALGVEPVAAEAMAGGWADAAGELTLQVPSGARGPAFLVSASFRAVLRYNASNAYALAVGLLAESLTAGRLPQVAWPEGEVALTRAEREELQRLLASQGHDVGTPDAIIGSQTRTAIRNWQRARSLPEDGHPSPDLLARLRAEKG